MNNAQLNYKFFFQLPKGLQLQSVFEEIQSFLEKYKFSSKRKSWNCFMWVCFTEKKLQQKRDKWNFRKRHLELLLGVLNWISKLK